MPSVYEPLLQYAEDDDDDAEEEEEEVWGGGGHSFSYHRPRRRMMTPEEMARFELDGNVSRRPNPMTIIQVKNPAKNVDSSSSSTSFSGRSRSRLFCCSVPTLLLLLPLLLLLWLLLRLLLSNTTDAPRESDPSLDWVRVFNKSVLLGGIQVVSLSDGDRIILSGFCGSHGDDGHRHGGSPDCGMLGLDASNGHELWRLPLSSRPTLYDCGVVDLNGDGHLDCLVTGRNGLLAALSPKSGDQLWQLYHHIPLTNLSLPRRVSDLDGDGIGDLVCTCAVTLPTEVVDGKEHERTNLLLVSGASGGVIGGPYLVDLCTDLASLNVTESLSLRFGCKAGNGTDEFEMSLSYVYEKATGDPPPPMKSDPSFRQFSSLSSSPSASSALKDSIHLDLKSSSSSPELGVVAILWDGFAHRTLWNQSWSRAVGFQPLATRFETDRWDSPVEGFVFRLWQWGQDQRDTFIVGREEKLTRIKSTTTSPRTTAFQPPSENEDEEEAMGYYFGGGDSLNEPFERDDSPPRQPPNDWMTSLFSFGRPMRRRLRRSLLGAEEEGWDDLIRLLSVRETLIYMTLNHTTPSVTDLYVHNIVQKCSRSKIGEAFSCKPHFDTQPQSMALLESSPHAVVFSSQTLDPSSGAITTTLRSLRLRRDASKEPHRRSSQP